LIEIQLLEDGSNAISNVIGAIAGIASKSGLQFNLGHGRVQFPPSPLCQLVTSGDKNLHGVWARDNR
jgi:hypothetical protein